MNTKPFILLCFLSALLLISAVATQPSKDGRQASGAAEESDTDVVELQGWGGGPGWGYGGRGGWGGGGWGGGRHGGWGYGGRGGWGGGGWGYGGRGGWGGGGWGHGV
ncbi:Glycine rich protein [Sesbania bispinosa]|nr:Glycine rich protein [Sesbania bispinosa]